MLRRGQSALAALVLAFAAAAARLSTAGEWPLADYGPAPEFTGIDAWLNSEPMTLDSLRGKVVLIEFWTYTCVNCARTLPYMRQWYDTYRGRGLQVIGVHTPEFAVERDRAKLEAAMGRYALAYPIAQDNGYRTWRAYGNEYWPTEYLIDRQGRIVLKHVGEGDYQEIEAAIRKLLAAAER